MAQNILKWSKRNPTEELNDEIIERVLTTRAVRNAIMYRGKYFKGPADLFRALGAVPKVSYKAFHLKLSDWRARNPNLSPSDSDIEQFASQIRSLTVDGRRVGPERAVWENLQRPKVSWSMFAKRLVEFRIERGRAPTTEEIAELSLPQREWMERDGNPQVSTNEGRQLLMEEFFASFDFEKVSLGTWRHRVGRFKSRARRKPNSDEAIELMRPWVLSIELLEFSIGGQTA